MQPLYTAKKSGWAGVTPLCVIFFFLIIPLIIMIFRIIAAKHTRIEFYDDHICVKSGWFSDNERNMVFMGIVSVSSHQNMWGILFNYGDVIVDAVGQWDVSCDHIKNPKGLQNYLQTRIVKTKGPDAAIRMNSFVEM